jgi:hypothetical protein
MPTPVATSSNAAAAAPSQTFEPNLLAEDSRSCDPPP